MIKLVSGYAEDFEKELNRLADAGWYPHFETFRVNVVTAVSMVVIYSMLMTKAYSLKSAMDAKVE
jgi:hypothetical protein